MMFGGPAYFVNGNMFAGVLGEQLMVRLDADDRAELLDADPGAVPFEPMPGRPMREYVTLPESIWGGRARFW
jgi:TfoX/Sxy family transcriptional regulator of competence genes